MNKLAVLVIAFFALSIVPGFVFGNDGDEEGESPSQNEAKQEADDGFSSAFSKEITPLMSGANDIYEKINSVDHSHLMCKSNEVVKAGVLQTRENVEKAQGILKKLLEKYPKHRSCFSDVDFVVSTFNQLVQDATNGKTAACKDYFEGETGLIAGPWSSFYNGKRCAEASKAGDAGGA